MKHAHEKLNRIFKYLGLAKEEIINEASFSEDFGFDSFKMGCLHFYLENYFNINISEKELIFIQTIGDVKQLVRLKLNSNTIEA